MKTAVSSQDKHMTEPAPRDSELRIGAPLFVVLLLVMAWAVAIFIIQEYTTQSNYPLPIAKAIGSRLVRFALNFLACGAIVFLIRGWLIYLVLLLGALGSLVLIVYFEYYGKALTWTIISNHFNEGVAVAPQGIQLLRWNSLLVVIGFVVLALLARQANRSTLNTGRRLRLGFTCAAGWLLLAMLSTQVIDRVAKLKSFGNVDRLAMTHGYTLTWLGEWWHLDEKAILERALSAARIRQDRLTPIESAIAPGEKVSIIQVESLDFDLLDANVNDEPVMPYLRDLLKRSMVYRIEAIHRSGSCDADFVMLMNLNPVGNVTPYNVRGFDWERSLAAHVRKQSYRSVFLHGNDGSFFHRGSGVRRMGFDRVLFRRTLEDEFNLPSKNWGISDRDVFAVSRDLLIAEPGRVLHFIITLTSHGPFHFVDREEWELFQEPRSEREHYLNSMRYVDTQLREYIEAMPNGTLIVLYGDHISQVDYGQPVPPAGVEYVPFVIYKTNEDLSLAQRTRGSDIAIGGTLTMLDATGYVWSMFRDSSGEY